METFKEYARLAWSTYKDLVATYPVKAPIAALAIGFALGYWVG